MTYAIVETGGKQLRVEPGRFYDIDRLAVDEEEAGDPGQGPVREQRRRLDGGGNPPWQGQP